MFANCRRAPEAEEAYRGAIHLHQSLAAVSAKPAYRDALARHFHNLGNLLARIPARQRQARESYQEAIRLHEQLAAERPAPAYQEALNQHRYKLGVLEGDGLEEKEKACRRRINDLEELLTQPPASPGHRHNLARRYHELGNLLALKAKEAIATARKLKAVRPPEVDAIVGEAEDAFQRAVELHEQLARENPDVSNYRRGLAQHYVNLGDLFLWTARQPQKARAPYVTALGLFKELAATDAAYEGDLGCTHEKLGQMWRRLPEPDRPAAREHLKKALVHLQIALKTAPDHGHYRQILGDATKALHDVQAGSSGG